MKAIETSYNGYRFRSRLEARWAVFFDAMGIEYRYEPEGFDLGAAGKYLPDFYLPKLNVWIEIKGSPITPEDVIKINAFAANGNRLYLFEGEIDAPNWMHDRGRADVWGWPCHCQETADESSVCERWDSGYQFCECANCGTIGIEFDGRSERIGCCDKGGDKDCNGRSSRILAAYTAARSARFEHGERGAPVRKTA